MVYFLCKYLLLFWRLFKQIKIENWISYKILLVKMKVQIIKILIIHKRSHPGLLIDITQDLKKY
jgi:hypothetical protein